MTDNIKAGTLLIEENARLPASFSFEAVQHFHGWRSVRELATHGVGQEVREAGWSFFFIAGIVDAIAFGGDSQKAL